MGDDRPQVIHVGYQPATVEQVYFPQAEVVGDIGRSLCAAGRPARGQAAERRRAAAAARGHPRPPRRPRHRRPLDAAAHRPRRAPGDAGRRHRRARQRHVQDLVRAQLPHPRRQHAAARQRARHHGRRPAVGDHGGDALPEAARARRVRRRRLHDEQPGAGDRGAAQAQPGGAGARRQRLRHDPLEAGGRRLRRFRHDLRQPRLRALRAGLRRAGPARRARSPSSRPALEAAFRAGGVHLVAVPIDYSENKRVLVDELRDRRLAK